MLDNKQIGWIQVVGALLASYFSWQTQSWGLLILAVVILVTGAHHLNVKNHKRH